MGWFCSASCVSCSVAGQPCASQRCFPVSLARAGAEAEVGAAGGAAERGRAAAAAPRRRAEGAAGRAGGEADCPAAEAQGEGEQQALPLALGAPEGQSGCSTPCPPGSLHSPGWHTQVAGHAPRFVFCLCHSLQLSVSVQERKLQDSENELEIRVKNVQARSEQLVSQVSRAVGLTELP